MRTARSIEKWICFVLFVLCLLPEALQSAESTPSIEWNPKTLTLIQSNGYYARIIRTKSGDLLCGFDSERKIWVRRSKDEGKTWSESVKVAEWQGGRLTNTELLQTRDGAILCFYNERPYRRRGESARPGDHPYSISMARSEDDGLTWQAPRTLYRAGVEFTNGCWEPAAIQLPSGEIQMFFSNEGPYRNSDEQEIDVMRSNDDGKKWTSIEKVSFRPGHRDGMPVPIVLNDNAGIAFAIEDNGLSGNFKPVIVYTTLEDNWRSGTRTPQNTNRWSALRELPAPHVAASAPYLRQMPSGETLLSFQRSDDGNIQHAYTVVCVGNKDVKNFGSPTRPFPVTEGKAQLWNSLFVKNKDTVMVVTEATINGVFGIWSIEGRFARR